MRDVNKATEKLRALVPENYRPYIHILDNGNLVVDLKGLCKAIGVEDDEQHQRELAEIFSMLADTVGIPHSSMKIPEKVQ
jgi:hypothetical protein